MQSFFLLLFVAFVQLLLNVSYSDRNPKFIISNNSSVIHHQLRRIHQNYVAYLTKTHYNSMIKYQKGKFVHPKGDLESDSVFAVEVLPLLFDVAQPHLFYLLYDDTFNDSDQILKTYTVKWTSSTVMKFTGDEKPILNALADPLVLSPTNRRYILVFCSMQNIETLFKMISLENLENPNTWWIIKIESDEGLNLLQGILREGSQVIAVHVESEQSIKFFSSVIDIFGSIRFHQKGKWITNSTNDIRNSFESIFANPEEQYSNFNGRQLTVSGNNYPGFLTVKKISSGEMALDSGYEVSLLKVLSNSLNFTMRITKPPDGKWGGPTSNGSVTGMIGEVFRRNAHFAMCSLSVTGLRDSVIDYTYPYTSRTITLLSQAPKEKSRVLAAFSPFTTEVWICIVIITIVAGLIVTLQARISSKYLPEKLKGFAIGNVLFNVTGSLLKQVNFLRAKGFTNTSLLLWYIFSLILSVLYSGMLTATLTKPSFEKPIDSLHDLPEAVANGYTLVTVEGSTLEYMFKFASEGIFAETWKLFNHKDRSKSFIRRSQDKLDKILTEKLTFVQGILGAKFNAKRIGPHLVHIARDVFGFELTGIACFSGAPFTTSFNKVLQRIAQSGLKEKWLNDEFLKIASKFTTEENKSHEAFTVMQLQAAFYIICLGYTLAGISLVFELWFKRQS